MGSEKSSKKSSHFKINVKMVDWANIVGDFSNL